MIEFKNEPLIITDIKKRLNPIKEEPPRDNKNLINENSLSSVDSTEAIISEKNMYNNVISAEEKDIRELIKSKRYLEAINLIDSLEEEKNIEDTDFYNKLMLSKSKCYNALNENKKAIEILDKVIEFNKKRRKNNNITLLIQKANIVESKKEKIKILKEAHSLNIYDPFILNILANAQEAIITESNKDLYNEIIINYDESLKLDPSISNDSYGDKLNFLIQNSNDLNEIIKTCDQIIGALKDKDPYSVIYFNAMNEKNYRELKTENITDNEFERIKETFNVCIDKNMVYERTPFYLNDYLRICSKLNRTDEIKKIFNDYDDSYSDNKIYSLRKAKCLVNNFRNLSNALHLLKSINKKLINSTDRGRASFYSFYLNCLFYNGDYQKACDINEEIPELNKFGLEVESLFEINKEKYLDRILALLDESDKNTQDYISYFYSLLKLEEYKEIYDTYKSLLDNSDVDTQNKVLRINYSLAKKKLGKTVNETNLSDILKEKEQIDPTVAAAYILTDSTKKAEDILEKLINKDYSNYYFLQKMPVFEEIDFSKFKKDEISTII